MKKWFIVLALALTGTVSGFAQQMSVGGRAGMQMTDYTKNGDGKAALKAFFGAGSPTGFRQCGLPAPKAFFPSRE